jgi:hypothetical protein
MPVGERNVNARLDIRAVLLLLPAVPHHGNSILQPARLQHPGQLPAVAGRQRVQVHPVGRVVQAVGVIEREAAAGLLTDAAVGEEQDLIVAV